MSTALGSTQFADESKGEAVVLLAMVERDFRFVALMAPIVNVEHAIWESPASAFMRRELRRAKIEPALVARHFHLSSPMHNQPLCDTDRVLFVAGDFDLIARPADILAIQQKWRGSELLRVQQDISATAYCAKRSHD